MRAAIDGAPHLADAAVGLGLVDGALFRDQAVKVAQRLAAANTARLAVSGAREGEGGGGRGRCREQQQWWQDGVLGARSRSSTARRLLALPA